MKKEEKEDYITGKGKERTVNGERREKEKEEKN